jgi:hypothetical protein
VPTQRVVQLRYAAVQRSKVHQVEQESQRVPQLEVLPLQRGQLVAPQAERSPVVPQPRLALAVER